MHAREREWLTGSGYFTSQFCFLNSIRTSQWHLFTEVGRLLVKNHGQDHLLVLILLVLGLLFGGFDRTGGGDASAVRSYCEQSCTQELMRENKPQQYSVCCSGTCDHVHISVQIFRLLSKSPRVSVEIATFQTIKILIACL